MVSLPHTAVSWTGSEPPLGVDSTPVRATEWCVASVATVAPVIVMLCGSPVKVAFQLNAEPPLTAEVTAVATLL